MRAEPEPEPEPNVGILNLKSVLVQVGLCKLGLGLAQVALLGSIAANADTHFGFHFFILLMLTCSDVNASFHNFF